MGELAAPWNPEAALGQRQSVAKLSPRPRSSRSFFSAHSHAIISDHGNALNLRRKFFLDTIGDRALVHQGNPLLIFYRNFRESHPLADSAK
jgi:hypothetical protein